MSNRHALSSKVPITTQKLIEMSMYCPLAKQSLECIDANVDPDLVLGALLETYAESRADLIEKNKYSSEVT